MSVGKVQSRHCFPDDLQQAVQAIREAQNLQEGSWVGMQLKACYIRRSMQLTEDKRLKDNACSAVEEICRYVCLAQ